eukprot:765941-Hanusia_phi.AAC.1
MFVKSTSCLAVIPIYVDIHLEPYGRQSLMLVDAGSKRDFPHALILPLPVNNNEERSVRRSKNKDRAEMGNRARRKQRRTMNISRRRKRRKKRRRRVKRKDEHEKEAEEKEKKEDNNV